MAAELAASLHSADLQPVAYRSTRRPAARVWSGIWPTMGAVVLTLVIWQLVVWSGWRPQSALPGPWSVLAQLGGDLRRADFYAAVGATLRRAAFGYAIAATSGFVVAVLIARGRILRRAVGSLLVVLLGAAPAIAAGLLAGIDQVHPQLIRVGRAMGADGLRLYRHVVLPAALPAFVGGLKQGWAFAWRSLMSAELLVVATNQTSLGQQLQAARNLPDARQLMALMIVIFVIGIVIDALFGSLDRAVKQRWGLGGQV